MQTEISIYIHIHHNLRGVLRSASWRNIIDNFTDDARAIYLHANARSSYSKYVYLYGLGVAVYFLSRHVGRYLRQATTLALARLLGLCGIVVVIVVVVCLPAYSVCTCVTPTRVNIDRVAQ